MFSNTKAIAYISIAAIYLAGLLSNQVTISLAFNDNHIIYDHMDVQWSIEFAQTYFTNPAYLVFQYWVHAAFYLPGTVNQTEIHACHYIRF